MLKISTFILGPVQTNTYLVTDTDTGESVVIDPSWGATEIRKKALELELKIKAAWITHAHFDHIAGVGEIIDKQMEICLHPNDLDLWLNEGGAQLFGFHIGNLPEPDRMLVEEDELKVGNYSFTVIHTPGHTQGHVAFYCNEEKVLFCGDVIFAESIGRTDFPGGNFDQLIHSIRTKIFPLPKDTQLLPGHGPATTVGHEQTFNPFL